MQWTEEIQWHVASFQVFIRHAPWNSISGFYDCGGLSVCSDPKFTSSVSMSVPSRVVFEGPLSIGVQGLCQAAV
eukprot:4894374-Pyramimonas_sp.AAC.2